MKIHVTVSDQTIEVEVGNVNARPIIARIGEEAFEVWPEDKASSSARNAKKAAARSGQHSEAPSTAQAEASEAAAPIAGAVNGKTEPAPLPGVVTGISAKPGQTVKAGQPLLDLEAMKMKNSICASREGVIAEILVSVGDTVRHGQALLKYV